MKKLLGQVANLAGEVAKGASKSAAQPSGLVGKTVVVGQFHVRVESVLGEGGFATIYRTRDATTQALYALKHIRLSGDPDALKEVQNEAKTMARLKGHPGITQLHAVAFAGAQGQETDGFLLLSYCSSTLLEVMQQYNFQLPDALVCQVFKDVCGAVAAMHHNNPSLAHRDLKAENVLRYGDGPDAHWVICDFGSATSRAQVYDTPAEMAIEEENIRRTTTPAYRAPEMWDLYARYRIDTKVDIWALGVLLYVLCFGKLPFQADAKLAILNCKYDLPTTRAQPLRTLIQMLLNVDPDHRPNISTVLETMDAVCVAMGLPPGPANAAQSYPPVPAPAPPPRLPHPAAIPHTPLPQSHSSQSHGSVGMSPLMSGLANHSRPPPSSPSPSMPDGHVHYHHHVQAAPLAAHPVVVDTLIEVSNTTGPSSSTGGQQPPGLLQHQSSHARAASIVDGGGFGEPPAFGDASSAFGEAPAFPMERSTASAASGPAPTPSATAAWAADWGDAPAFDANHSHNQQQHDRLATVFGAGMHAPAPVAAVAAVAAPVAHPIPGGELPSSPLYGRGSSTTSTSGFLEQQQQQHSQQQPQAHPLSQTQSQTLQPQAGLARVSTGAYGAPEALLSGASSGSYTAPIEPGGCSASASAGARPSSYVDAAATQAPAAPPLAAAAVQAPAPVPTPTSSTAGAYHGDSPSPHLAPEFELLKQYAHQLEAQNRVLLHRVEALEEASASQAAAIAQLQRLVMSGGNSMGGAGAAAGRPTDAASHVNPQQQRPVLQHPAVERGGSGRAAAAGPASPSAAATGMHSRSNSVSKGGSFWTQDDAPSAF